MVGLDRATLGALVSPGCARVRMPLPAPLSVSVCLSVFLSRYARLFKLDNPIAHMGCGPGMYVLL